MLENKITGYKKKFKTLEESENRANEETSKNWLKVLELQNENSALKEKLEVIPLKIIESCDSKSLNSRMISFLDK